MMKKRKGRMLSMLVVFVLLFISGGSLVSSVFASNAIQETVEYSTSDVNTLAEAKTNAEIYRFNIRKELNYSFNNVAYELGPEAGNLDWRDNIPSMSDINQSLKQQILNRGRVNIREQNRAGDCTPPRIMASMLEIESMHELSLEFSDPWIKCSTTGSKGFIPVQERYEIENLENNYLKLAHDAKKLATQSRSIIENTEWEREGSTKEGIDYVEIPDGSVEGSCYHVSSSDDNSAKEAAKDSARDRFNGISIASAAYEDLDPEFSSDIDDLDDESDFNITESEAEEIVREDLSDNDWILKDSTKHEEEGYYTFEFRSDDKRAKAMIDGSSEEVIELIETSVQDLYLFTTDIELDTEITDGNYNSVQGYPKNKKCTYRKCLEQDADGCIERAEEDSERFYKQHKFEFEVTELESFFIIEDSENSVTTYDAPDSDLMFNFTYVNTQELG